MRDRRWLSVGAAVLLLVAGVFFWNYNQKTSGSKLAGGSYQRALFSMVSHVQNLNSLL